MTLAPDIRDARREAVSGPKRAAAPTQARRPAVDDRPVELLATAAFANVCWNDVVAERRDVDDGSREAVGWLATGFNDDSLLSRLSDTRSSRAGEVCL